MNLFEDERRALYIRFIKGYFEAKIEKIKRTGEREMKTESNIIGYRVKQVHSEFYVLVTRSGCAEDEAPLCIYADKKNADQRCEALRGGLAHLQKRKSSWEE